MGREKQFMQPEDPFGREVASSLKEILGSQISSSLGIRVEQDEEILARSFVEAVVDSALPQPPLAILWFVLGVA